MAPPPGTAMGRLAFRALLVWALLALGLGAVGAFEAGPGESPWALAAAALLPPAAAVILHLRFADIRRWVLSLDARGVTLAQTLRLAGVLFALARTGGVPGLFAAAAAWDALLIGAVAPFVAFVVLVQRPQPRGTVALWNGLGLADLAVLLALVLAAGPGAPTAFPLVLVPALLMPLFAILHLMGLAQARAASPPPAR